MFPPITASEEVETFRLAEVEVYYAMEEDVEEDCIKNSHFLVDLQGNIRKEIDWSPYSSMSSANIRKYIELGCPSRKDVPTIGPLREQDLDLLLTRREMVIKQPDTNPKPLIAHVKLS